MDGELSRREALKAMVAASMAPMALGLAPAARPMAPIVHEILRRKVLMLRGTNWCPLGVSMGAVPYTGVFGIAMVLVPELLWELEAPVRLRTRWLDLRWLCRYHDCVNDRAYEGVREARLLIRGITSDLNVGPTPRDCTQRIVYHVAERFGKDSPGFHQFISGDGSTQRVWPSPPADFAELPGWS